MRLTREEIDGIKAGVAAYFGEPRPVRVFGSRVDDARKGSDIDLLVEAPAGRASFQDEIGVQMALMDHLGERKIDILLVVPGAERSPMEDIVYRDGVLL